MNLFKAVSLNTPPPSADRLVHSMLDPTDFHYMDKNSLQEKRVIHV